MTALSPTPLTGTAAWSADDRYVVVNDPRPGTIVELAPGSQLAVPDWSSTSRWTSPETSRRLNELNVYITLSGCSCGVVLSPGRSVYSRTRTRSFSKTTL